MKPGWKFLAGLVVYALVVWGMTLFDDYRVSVFGLFALCFLTFAMALWSLVRNNKAVSLLLVVALLLAPTKGGCDDAKSPAQKDAVGAVIAGCGVLAVGAVIIWGLWKICKKMPGPTTPPKNPPTTNPPPDPDSLKRSFAAASTNGPVLVMPDLAITEQNTWDIAVIQYQSTTNATDWVPEYTATNWFNNSQFVSILYSNGLPLMTNYGAAYWTNDVMVSDFSAVMPSAEQAPLRLWRGVQLQ